MPQNRIRNVSVHKVHLGARSNWQHMLKTYLAEPQRENLQTQTGSKTTDDNMGHDALAVQLSKEAFGYRSMLG